MQTSSIATEATYFQYGLEIDLVSEKEVQDWAFSLIESLDSPSYEIIAVAQSSDINQLHTALSAIFGERDRQLAGKWLLGLIKIQLSASLMHPRIAARKAIQISRSTKLDESIYNTFNHIDDEIYLAETEKYGAVEESIADLMSALESYEPFRKIK